MEKNIVNSVMKYLNSLPECKAEKRHGSGYGKRGEPDISACYKGQRIEIEVKQPGKKPTKLQEKRLREWGKAGAVAVWADKVENVIKLIEHFDRVIIDYGKEKKA